MFSGKIEDYILFEDKEIIVWSFYVFLLLRSVTYC